MLGLRKCDETTLLLVLKDIEKCVRCEVGIGGSVAQRALSPKIERTLAGKPLHDIDLLLIGTSAFSPELPEMRKRFIVEEITNDAGWYYGLRHKRTRIWVDLFGIDPSQELVKITLGDKKYQASTLVSQIKYLTQDILRRAERGLPVRKKWLDKLSTLVSLADSALSPDLRLQIKKALEEKTTSGFRDLLFGIKWWFKRTR